MRVLALAVCLVLAGCHEHILELGDGEVDDTCRWVVTVDKPAVISVHDLDRCVGRVQFIILSGDER